MTKQKLDNQHIENVNDDCKEIYEEINATRNLLNWSEKKLFEECFYEHTDHELCNTDEEDECEKRKFCNKYKKISQRKNWGKRKATKRTLYALENLRDALYKTEEYNKIETILPPKIREKMRKISKKLDQKIK